MGRASHEVLHALREDGTHYPANECPIVRAVPGHSRPRGREVFIGRSGHSFPVRWTVSGLPRSRYKLLSFDSLEQDARASRSQAPHLPSADDIYDQISDGFRDPELTPLRIAEMNHISLRSLQSILAREGTSPASRIRSERLRYAAQLLDRGMPPRIAASDAGFTDISTFSRAFRRPFGVSPSAYSIHAPVVDGPEDGRPDVRVGLSR